MTDEKRKGKSFFMGYIYGMLILVATYVIKSTAVIPVAIGACIAAVYFVTQLTGADE